MLIRAEQAGYLMSRNQGCILCFSIIFRATVFRGHETACGVLSPTLTAGKIGSDVQVF
jgi:hypothetical protein